MVELSDTEHVINLNWGSGQHRFRFAGGPIDNPERHKRLFAALGLAAASWARLEKHVDAVLIQINKAQHSSQGLSLYDPKHPKPFSDKIKLLKKYFSRHPALEPHRENMTVLLETLPKLSGERNLYLHSILEDADPSTDAFYLNTIEGRKSGYQVTHADGTLALLKSFTKTTNQANRILSWISGDLFTRDALERLRTP